VGDGISPGMKRGSNLSIIFLIIFSDHSKDSINSEELCHQGGMFPGHQRHQYLDQILTNPDLDYVP